MLLARQTGRELDTFGRRDTVRFWPLTEVRVAYRSHWMVDRWQFKKLPSTREHRRARFQPFSGRLCANQKGMIVARLTPR